MGKKDKRECGGRRQCTEVAPGPGYLAIELAKLGNYNIVGLDISATFVEIAKKRAKEAGVPVEFRRGDVTHMPFGNESFDFIICRSAFKNFSDPIGALNEMYRVSTASGKTVIIDLRRDVSRRAIDDYVDNLGLSRINSLITKWTFRFMLTKRAYTKDEFNKFISESRFQNGEIHENPVGFESWLQK